VMRILDLNGLCGTFLPLSKRDIRSRLDEIPHFRSPGGGKLLFRSDEVLAWLEKYRVRPIDLDEAHRVAEELTSGRRQKRKEAR
jgi:hypothetical protein